MAKQDDTARQELRDLLVMLRDALGQPPVGALLAALAIRTIRLLAEQDLGKRMAMREQIQAYLVETWGESLTHQRPPRFPSGAAPCGRLQGAVEPVFKGALAGTSIRLR